jgi:hypothetical protein
MVENPFIGRIVTLLTPIFAGLAGAVALLVAKYLPGAPTLDTTELTAIFITGFLTVVPIVHKWLDNRGKYEERQELLGSTDLSEIEQPASSALGVNAGIGQVAPGQEFPGVSQSGGSGATR